MKTLVFLLCLSAVTVCASAADQTNELDTLRIKYDQAQGKINREVFSVYSNNVAGMVSEFKKKGDFAACVMLAEEQKAMTALPIVPTGEARDALTKGIAGYGEMIGKLDADKTQRLLKLQKLYVEKLDKLLKTLLTTDRMDDAKQANDEKMRIEALMAASKQPVADEAGAPAVEPDPTAAAKDNTEPEGIAAKTSKTIGKNLLIIKATITIKNEKSRDVTEDVRSAVQDNRLVFRDWNRRYRDWSHYSSDSLLTIQYRFGNGMMKSIQGRNGNPVFIGENDNR